MQPTAGTARLADVAVTALAPAAWGLTYLATTEFLPPGRPLLAGAARALPAGLILVAIARRRPQGVWWLKAAVLGVLNIGAFFALLFAAAYRLPGGVAATLGAVQPLVAACLATAGTAIAYLLWFRGIAKLPVSQVSLLGLASPIVATVSGWIVLHQTLAATQLLGGALVLTAVWLGQRPTQPTAPLQRQRTPWIGALVNPARGQVAARR